MRSALNVMAANFLERMKMFTKDRFSATRSADCRENDISVLKFSSEGACEE
ncbi:unnamed protein product [Callosobruchus maculatus]|uniref:Uncharacterized protein n=1 Tax=Callosobruchus maculatus TaxID=64391 RepID=A0A653D8K7_CALMS|nr:unnamed protein product [Callosobruchus maculatus]